MQPCIWVWKLVDIFYRIRFMSNPLQKPFKTVIGYRALLWWALSDDLTKKYVHKKFFCDLLVSWEKCSFQWFYWGLCRRRVVSTNYPPSNRHHRRDFSSYGQRWTKKGGIAPASCHRPRTTRTDWRCNPHLMPYSLGLGCRLAQSDRSAPFRPDT